MTIIEQLKQILEYNTSMYNDINLKYVEENYNTWLKNKQHIINSPLFNGELIIKKDLDNVTLVPPDSKFVKENIKTFIMHLTIKLSDYIDIVNFIIANITTEQFYENKLHHNWSDEIKKGMRLTKALQKIIPDAKIATELINTYSMMLQNYHISGQLCLSVHPFDYLTISDNVSNWRSCHSLDNGEYRAGNLAYMCDKSTVVAYICSKQEKVLNVFPEKVKWNDKKWRVLLHFNKDLTQIVINKQYPFTNDNLLNLIKNIFFENWTMHPISRELIHNNIHLHYVRNTNLGAKSELFYMDIYYSSYNFKPFILKAKECDKIDDFYIGERVACASCGYELNLSNDFVCSYCNHEYTHCDLCGTPIHQNNTHYLSGNTLCESCYDNEIIYCDRCGCELMASNDSEYYITDNLERFCESCYYEYKDEQ